MWGSSSGTSLAATKQVTRRKSDSLPEKLKAVLVFFSHGNLPEW